jgi:hypothetical protein
LCCVRTLTCVPAPDPPPSPLDPEEPAVPDDVPELEAPVDPEEPVDPVEPVAPEEPPEPDAPVGVDASPPVPLPAPEPEDPQADKAVPSIQATEFATAFDPIERIRIGAPRGLRVAPSPHPKKARERHLGSTKMLPLRRFCSDANRPEIDS